MRRVTTLSILALLAVTACSDNTLSPPLRQLAASRPNASAAAQPRPFKISQTWAPSDNDYEHYQNCEVTIPNPVIPGESIDLVISGLLHSSGTATHLGRYTADTYIDGCTWNAQAGALDITGHMVAMTANGETLSGALTAQATFGLNGSDFVGTMTIVGGTGRFAGASGSSSMNSHDAPDGSGVGWGSGWIVY